MQNFEYYTPTRVVFGQDVENRAGELVKACGGSKVLVHYGGGSAKKSGLLDRVFASLKAAGLPYVELGGVQPNPRLALVKEGVALCQKENVDFLLAVGGGSVIDSAKGIGYGVAGGTQEVWAYYERSAEPVACLPLGVVLTIAAAGSEMSDSSVITNEETGVKRGLSNDLSRPRFALMNPALTLTLPAYQTAAGAADIVMHTLERYFTPEPSKMEITDALAEGLLRTVMANARLLARKPDNYDARAEVMWAGALSHNGLTGCGQGQGDWATHQLGHELSAKYDAAHGASLTTMWGSWARYVYKKDPARFAQLALNVLEIPDEGQSSEELALAGIEEMESFFWAIEMPTSISELGFEPTNAELDEMARRCTFYGKRTIGSLRALNEADIREIYEMAR